MLVWDGSCSCKGKKVSYLVNENKLKWNGQIYDSKAWYIVCVWSGNSEM